MLTLKYHIIFMSAQEAEKDVTLKYRANSYSAFLSLKQHIEVKYDSAIEIKFQACMSAEAPVF